MQEYFWGCSGIAQCSAQSVGHPELCLIRMGLSSFSVWGESSSQLFYQSGVCLPSAALCVYVSVKLFQLTAETWIFNSFLKLWLSRCWIQHQDVTLLGRSSLEQSPSDQVIAGHPHLGSMDTDEVVMQWYFLTLKSKTVAKSTDTRVLRVYICDLSYS